MSSFSDCKLFTIKNPTGTMVGSGSIVLNNLVRISFTIIKGAQGIFASLPATKGNKPDENGKIPWYPQVKLLTEELYAEFQNIVKKEFAKVLGAGSVPKSKPAPPIGEEPQKDYDDGYPF